MKVSGRREHHLTALLKQSVFFFFNDTPPTEIYPLPLHAPLPISKCPPPLTCAPRRVWSPAAPEDPPMKRRHLFTSLAALLVAAACDQRQPSAPSNTAAPRSTEIGRAHV